MSAIKFRVIIVSLILINMFAVGVAHADESNLIAYLAKKALKQIPGPAKIIISSALATDSVLTKIDSAVERAANKSVQKANGFTSDWSPVIALDYKSFEAKEIAKMYVGLNGGVAWVQAGSNRRLGLYWHPCKSFKPKGGDDTPLGHIERGQSNYPNLGEVKCQ